MLQAVGGGSLSLDPSGTAGHAAWDSRPFSQCPSFSSSSERACQSQEEDEEPEE